MVGEWKGREDGVLEGIVADKDDGKSVERGYYPDGGNGEAGVMWWLTSLAWATNSITSYQVISLLFSNPELLAPVL